MVGGRCLGVVSLVPAPTTYASKLPCSQTCLSSTCTSGPGPGHNAHPAEKRRRVPTRPRPPRSDEILAVQRCSESGIPRSKSGGPLLDPPSRSAFRLARILRNAGAYGTYGLDPHLRAIVLPSNGRNLTHLGACLIDRVVRRPTWLGSSCLFGSVRWPLRPPTLANTF